MTTDTQTPQTAKNGEINKEVPKVGETPLSDVQVFPYELKKINGEIWVKLQDYVDACKKSYKEGRADERKRLYGEVLKIEVVDYLDDHKHGAIILRDDILDALSQQGKEV